MQSCQSTQITPGRAAGLALMTSMTAYLRLIPPFVEVHSIKPPFLSVVSPSLEVIICILRTGWRPGTSRPYLASRGYDDDVALDFPRARIRCTCRSSHMSRANKHIHTTLLDVLPREGDSMALLLMLMSSNCPISRYPSLLPKDPYLELTDRLFCPTLGTANSK